MNRFGLKLTLWYVLLFLVTSMIISLSLYQQLKHQLYEEVDFFLADEMNEFSQFVSEHRRNLPLIASQMQKESVAIRKDYQMYYSVLDAQKKIAVQSSELHLKNPEIRNAQSTVFPKADIKEYKVSDEKHQDVVRILTQPIKNRNVSVQHVQVGMNMTRIETTLSNFRRNILITVPVFLGLSFAGGFVLAYRNLRPISQMSKAASRISATNLKERLPLRGTGDELDNLARTFNGMIGRIEEAYQKQAQFSSDAAHELRTPITSLMGEIESALSYKSTPEKYRSVLASNLEELARLKQLIAGLLFLSQQSRPADAETKSNVELNPLVRDMAELFEPVANDARIDLTCDLPPFPVHFRGEKSRIEQVVSNLIDNAIRYSNPGGNVSVRLRQGETHAEITVVDKGIGIPESEQQKIFDRFYRSEPSRSRSTGGFGLGLSIVKSIVDSYGGRIALTSAMNEGSTFTVTLPLRPA